MSHDGHVSRFAAAAPPAGPSPLRLHEALQLLASAGVGLPDGDAGKPGWMQALIDRLVDLSSRDALTGLVNRRGFELALARELDRVARSGEPALLLAVDIDHFKRINDGWGHGAGDEVLRTISRLLLESVRPMDLVARIGGEEFAIILPSCAPAFGETVAERVRRRVGRLPVAVGVGARLEVTVSICGAYAPPWVRSTPALWLERADRQLYRAKSLGRNLVQFEPTTLASVSAEERRLLFDSSALQDLDSE